MPGLVHVNGLQPTSPAAAREIGIAVVFQEILLADGASVLDNLYLGHDGLFRVKMSPQDKRARARADLERLVGTRVDLDQDVHALTLSMRQWIVIARALLRRPSVVVFDESTAALDYASTERFFEEVTRLRDAGVCVVLITHRISELTGICDRATVLQDGTDVGTLEGDEIVEKRLLELMSSKTEPSVEEKSAPAPARTGVEADVEERLVVSGVKLSGQAQPIRPRFPRRGDRRAGRSRRPGPGQVHSGGGRHRPASRRPDLRGPERDQTRDRLGEVRRTRRHRLRHRGPQGRSSLFQSLGARELRHPGLPTRLAIWLHRPQTGQEDVQRTGCEAFRSG